MVLGEWVRLEARHLGRKASSPQPPDRSYEQKRAIRIVLKIDLYEIIMKCNEKIDDSCEFRGN